MVEIVYKSRAQWGSLASTETYIKNRYSASPAEKTTVQVHHTAHPDDDTTTNRWSYADAEKYMKALQWVRPELGPLPYSVCFAVSEDAKTVWCFEGRGILKVGAHTAGHNRDGVGLSVFANFDKKDTAAAGAVLEAMQTVASDLKHGTSEVSWLKNFKLPNLGTVKNPEGWEAWGHRDSSTKSCPGNTFYPLLSEFTLKGDVMTPAQEAKLDELKALILATPGATWKHPQPDDKPEVTSAFQYLIRTKADTVAIRAAVGGIDLELDDLAESLTDIAINEGVAETVADLIAARLVE